MKIFKEPRTEVSKTTQRTWFTRGCAIAILSTEYRIEAPTTTQPLTVRYSKHFSYVNVLNSKTALRGRYNYSHFTSEATKAPKIKHLDLRSHCQLQS